MNKKAITNVKILNFIGILFLLYGIVAIIDNIVLSDTGIAPVLWMSYICLIILSIGILKKDAGLIASQMAILAIPYLIWNIDFFHHLFSGESLFGITDYYFKHLPLLERIISFQHIFNIPLSLYSIYLIGIKNSKFWIISLFQITLVFFITRAVTDYERNVNCVYRNCANFTFGLPHIVEWFLTFIVMISLTSWFLIKVFKKY